MYNSREMMRTLLRPLRSLRGPMISMPTDMEIKNATMVMLTTTGAAPK